jgi:hypothetical protein
MNKGLKLVNNPDSYVLFLNSDDYFYNNQILENIALLSNNSDFIYGNVEIQSNYGNRMFGYKCNHLQLLRRTIPHQSIFAKRYLFDLVGYFDFKYKFIADHDFVLKVFENSKIEKIVYSSDY